MWYTFFDPDNKRDGDIYNRDIKRVVVVVDDENEPTTPVVISETKTIEATVAECPNMNYLLQRFEMGESLDLSAQSAFHPLRNPKRCFRTFEAKTRQTRRNKPIDCWRKNAMPCEVKYCIRQHRADKKSYPGDFKLQAIHKTKQDKTRSRQELLSRFSFIHSSNNVSMNPE